MTDQIVYWALTVATILAITFQMKKYWWAPIYGLAHEGLWVALVVVTQAWPLLIGVAAYSIVYASSIRKWYRERNGTNGHP